MEMAEAPRLPGRPEMDNQMTRNAVDGDAHDQLTQMVAELSFQNDYLKAQLHGWRTTLPARVDVGGLQSEELKRLQNEISNPSKEIPEQRKTRKGTEDALEHMKALNLEANAEIKDLSTQLAQAQKKLEEEIKVRDDKYAELDSKFGRLHKRAKQRIQDIQKEKDDLEAHLLEVKEKSEQISAQQSSAQNELEYSLQHANEARKTAEIEKQLLRSTNIKLRENMDELHRAVEAKESALEELRQTILERDQALDNVQNLLKSAEEKKQASIVDLSSKHQKILESKEAQLADALSDRTKAAETIASLQVLIVEKDSRIAELDAATTGEAVRLKAAVEAAKQELIHLKNEHDKEKEDWQATFEGLKKKLEASESARLHSEIEAAKARCQLESEFSLLEQTLNRREADLSAAQEEVKHIENEFSSYKVRAHALLQKKEAELSSARDTELIKAKEEALKEAEREVSIALIERDKALQDLQNTKLKHEEIIAERDATLAGTQERIKSFLVKFETINAQCQSDKEMWQKNLEEVEERWRVKYSALEAQNNMYDAQNLQNRLDELKMRHKKLKEEHDSFCSIADRMMEEKEKEIIKLKEENMNICRSLELRLHADNSNIDHHQSAFGKQDPQGLSIAEAEQQILLLAKQQAQREEELARSHRHILALQEEIEELEHENRLHSQQEAMLKEELRDMERKQKREGVDMTYLKNVILKLLETGEVEALLPVVGMLLQFTPEEIRKCQQAYSSDISSSPSASPNNVGAHTTRSLFSRLSFT